MFHTYYITWSPHLNQMTHHHLQPLKLALSFCSVVVFLSTFFIYNFPLLFSLQANTIIICVGQGKLCAWQTSITIQRAWRAWKCHLMLKVTWTLKNGFSPLSYFPFLIFYKPSQVEKASDSIYHFQPCKIDYKFDLNEINIVLF